MTRLTPWGLVHHIPVFISRHRKHDMMNKKFIQEENMYQQNEGPNRRAQDPNNTKKKGFSTSVLIPWFFRSSPGSRDKSFTPADVKEAIMTKMIARNATLSPDQMQKLTRVDSTELCLLDTDKRTSSGTQAGHSFYDKQFNDVPLLPLSHSGTTEIMYQSPQLSPLPPALPPHYNTGSSSRSSSRGNGAQLNNDGLLQDQGKANQLEARTTELSNRVEELEIILSEYFINTAYLDELRARKNIMLSSPTKPETYNNN